jgi:demethylspheroidene O-methyltransferase
VFATEALQRFPDLCATVFDLPDVVPLAAQRFASAGLTDRAAVHAGDMFAGEFPPGADIVSLVRILHDHDDLQVLRLLRALRESMASDGQLLVAEPMAGTRQAPSVGAYFHLYLWAMRSGRPRSRAELHNLLEHAGFAAIREIKTFQPLQVRVLVARPGQLS